MADETRSHNDMTDHVNTYDTFIWLTKWSTIIVVVILILMAFFLL
ncbi:aa3-type cytochrome c oxidase subunit IV [Lutibaculum baratangense]|uniref:Cytochrome c oxidase subunit IV bacterial aa3 type domain-containing protein n=1 Tax=Lutibaculum baratangense AMV1 TaxID=631454 RepID=V4QTM9_9HYPH|nr:aa3-type cytochrome c oxidase subunit IV [Lutibaculum baratangense]ESR23117.1 hypothetical protein N177_3185 [Lutibaculum baratangense AMV1]